MNKLKLGFLLTAPAALLFVGYMGGWILSAVKATADTFLSLSLESQIRTVLALLIFIPFCIGILIILTNLEQIDEWLKEEK